MDLRITLTLVFLIITALFLPVYGDLTRISPGSTVFLGEENLDISASGVSPGSEIGWWAPGSTRTSEPTATVMVSSPSNFYVSPSEFSGKEGLWYTYPGGNLVFNVKRPSISVRVYDESSDFDATGRWIPRGDAVGFHISSNVYQASGRGGAGGEVDIVLKSPQGSRYSSVSGPSGSFSLEGIPLTSSLTDTGPVWSTGGEDTGTWTVQGEITLNGIKDNLGDLGVGISEPVEVLIQNVNPLIKSGSDTAVEVSPGSEKESVTGIATPVPTAIPAQKTPSVTVVPAKTVMAPAINTTLPALSPSLTPAPTEVPHQVQTTSEPVQPETTQSPLTLIPIFSALGLFGFLRKR